mgnify:CR=1 FL=1
MQMEGEHAAFAIGRNAPNTRKGKEVMDSLNKEQLDLIEANGIREAPDEYAKPLLAMARRTLTAEAKVEKLELKVKECLQ